MIDWTMESCEAFVHKLATALGERHDTATAWWDADNNVLTCDIGNTYKYDLRFLTLPALLIALDGVVMIPAPELVADRIIKTRTD